MVEDLSLDKLGGNLSNTNHIGLQQLHKNTITHILIDIWRKNNTKKSLFAYHNSDNAVHSGSDQIHTTRNLTFKNLQNYSNIYL